MVMLASMNIRVEVFLEALTTPHLWVLLPCLCWLALHCDKTRETDNLKEEKITTWMWWYAFVIPALGTQAWVKSIVSVRVWATS